MRNTLLVCALIALAPSLAMAQQKQLSVTTASPEALVLYQQALDFAENVESERSRPLLDQAIQKDPGFAMAYALRAVTGDGFNVARQNREKALSLSTRCRRVSVSGSWPRRRRPTATFRR